MYSLFHILNGQHGDELFPVRCNRQTVKRLVSYFEDMVSESRCSVLVLEGRCLDGDADRESERLEKLASAARHLFLFTCDSDCVARTWDGPAFKTLTLVEEHDHHRLDGGPFVVFMDPRFCGLLACAEIPRSPAAQTETYAVTWTFDPNVVYTAIEYLLARIGTQRPDERSRLEMLMNATTTRRPSLQVALTFTTKLAMLMQRQSELDMATSRISSAISSTLELESILQTAVEEVGRALNARRAALVLWQEGTSLPEGISIYERTDESAGDVAGDNELLKKGSLTANSTVAVIETPPLPLMAWAAHETTSRVTNPFAPEETFESARLNREMDVPGALEIPLTYRNSIIGVLVAEDDTPNRVWEDEEMLMVRTVSDQLAVAISHARLFRQVQVQAMTDSLTGLYNYRYFQERLDREIKAADRNNESLSLILLDLDHLKRINDTHGHRAGDAALRHVASILQATVRDIDVCARYGGEEFVIILPKCSRDAAFQVAERVREAIALKTAPRVGVVTASIGLATYPAPAKTKEELIEMADRAMYQAKEAGRNRVRILMHRASDGLSV
ncbi:MAG: diguanylate cyclase [Blastocatellia bacterium]